MNLSRFFTLDELTFSPTAKAEGIPNQPTETEVESLRALCTAVLDPLREVIGQPIKVNSGYRGPVLNQRIKGATKSQHLNGQAADIQCPALSVLELFKTVIRMKLPFDQVIYEVQGASKWVHLSHDPAAARGEIRLAKFDANGKATYPLIAEQEALNMSEPATRSGAMLAPTYVETGDEPPEDETPMKKIPAKKTSAKKSPAKTSSAKKTPAKKAGTKPAVVTSKAPPRKK
jgi:zinc D-Ala-D-Ala carboxypeptidase